MSQSPAAMTARVALTIGGRLLETELTVPTAAVSLRELLPVFRGLAEAVIDGAVQDVKVAGQAVSCKKGCGACCRQLVPITEPEASVLRDLLDGLPEPRRTMVRRRFAEARERLAEAQLLEKLEHPERFADADLQQVGLAYFHVGVACPFLEEESCSIYPDRPIACREYLVTSPAEHCARPTAETVRCVPMAGKVSAAVLRAASPDASRFLRWVPLILAPGWASNDVPQPTRPGPQWVESVFKALIGKELPNGYA